jgi:hypothetical protein
MSQDDPKAEGNQNILRNLRAEFPDLVHFKDEHILEEYNYWNVSDKSETFLQWIIA